MWRDLYKRLDMVGPSQPATRNGPRLRVPLVGEPGLPMSSEISLEKLLRVRHTRFDTRRPILLIRSNVSDRRDAGAVSQ